MKIAILGLGYVGITTAACFAKLGHEIHGIEINDEKLATLKKGHVSIQEPEVQNLLIECSNKITYSDSLHGENFDLIFVCVGTPTNDTGVSDLYALDMCIAGLAKDYIYDCPIVIRSTLPIGQCRKYKNFYKKLNLVFHPEFLREGSAVEDFFTPPVIIFGHEDANFSLDEKMIFSNLYEDSTCKKFHVSFEDAESAKYASNIFHAVKIVFTNEISKSITGKGANPNKVMEMFTSDSRLNISKAYLKPGFAYGGSCLEKDLLSFRNQFSNIELPLLDAVSPSNGLIIKEYFEKIVDLNNSFILNGVTFKESIDDLRRSPFIELANLLLNAGKKVYIYDDNIDHVFGENSQIKAALVSREFCYLNETLDQTISCETIYCHKSRHSKLPKWAGPDWHLYPNDNIGQLFQ